MKCTYSFILLVLFYTFHVLYVCVRGLEPPTFAFQVRHSTRLSYTQILMAILQGL